MPAPFPNAPGLRIRAALLVLLGCLAVTAASRGADPVKPADDKEEYYNEPKNCMDCHTFPKASAIDNGALKFVLLTEYAAWKTQDKHAQAHAILTGTRGQEMAKRLKQAGLPSEVATDAGAGCLNCHAMNNLPAPAGKHYALEEGVSCAGCHGVSGKWGLLHSNGDVWRKKSPKEKEDLGMKDLRDPARRAELCLSCHVGDATDGKVVTHAMYAAGHPPLPPIEVALFSKNLPQHWRDAKDVPYFDTKDETIRRNYHLETVDFQNTRQALIGSVASFRMTMRLVAARGDQGIKVPDLSSVWPELRASGVDGKPLPANDVTGERAMQAWPAVALGHSDCYACHHELAVPSWRQQRRYGLKLPDGGHIRTTPGRPQVRLWSMGLLGPAIRYVARAKPPGYEKQQVELLSGYLKALASACDGTPFGDAADVKAAAAQLAGWSQGLLDELAKAEYSTATAIDLLNDLCSPDTTDGVDYETARLIASAARVVYQEIVLKTKGTPQADAALKTMGDQLDLQPYKGRSDRQAVIDRLLRESLKSDYATGMADFAKALQQLSNRQLQLDQTKNAFLKALSDAGVNQDLTKAFHTQANSNDLQAISDKELAAFLTAVNTYGPAKFLGDIKDVREHPPAKPEK
jgi:hypothetical protein